MSDKQKPAAPKKGRVIDRRHNRTVPQGFATKDPVWKDLGGGFLQHMKHPTAFVRLDGGKRVSATRMQVDFHLAQQAAQESA